MQIRLNHKFSSHKPTAVGSGLVALDVLLRDERTAMYSALGGSAGNVLAILAHLGWSVTPVASLGRDAAAQRIYDEFKRLHADTRFLAYDGHQHTPVVYQFQSGDCGSTHKFSFSCPFCGVKRGFLPPQEDTLSDTVLKNAAVPSVFYFDRVTPWALELAEKFRANGAIVMFEPSVIGNDFDAFQRAINAAHILKYADDRIDDLHDFHRGSVEVEVQTRGKHGLQFRTRSVASWHELPAFEVPYLADTAGAGDWCSAGFLFALIGSVAENGGTGLMSARRVRESLRFGQILAALNCMQVGARGLARQFDRSHIVSMAAAIRNAVASSAISDHFAKVVQRSMIAPTDQGGNHAPPVDQVPAEEQRSWLCCKPLLI